MRKPWSCLETLEIESLDLARELNAKVDLVSRLKYKSC